ncbi:hypothetical protein HMPREF0620_1579 [Parascardovia denticolens DSM 10105 = JCM 12538]|uniref:Uncharacterized protein n=1 Tax=Parascardovia denticolens DSM 10105 = JCM 12538 TaxID=864564 RepID=E6K2A6_PARDN|nr:hypothetical protein HMPREF0620_1579 [Parascardovia denticolens DSM 10105 = JCM 12538]
MDRESGIDHTQNRMWSNVVFLGTYPHQSTKPIVSIAAFTP